MDVSFSQAANAYASRMRSGTNDEAEGAAAASSGGGFSQLLGSAVESSVNAIKQAEALKMESLTGKVDMADLVTAVANAELTLNTVVAVRDRVISAYQDIIRMPI